MKGDYEDFQAFGRQKNKANSKPILWFRVQSSAVKAKRIYLKKQACPFNYVQGRL